MALVIEDGSIVENADSYVSVAEARTFAGTRGVSLSAVDAEVEVLAHKAMDFLESLRDNYKGSKVSASQEVQWPRKDVAVDGFDVAQDTIPTLLKRAQMQLIIELNDGTDPLATGEGREIIEEKVDVLTTKYAETGANVVVPALQRVDAFLAPLLESSSSSPNISVSRA